MMLENETFGRLDGKVCIITGSSSGIGRAIAVAYAQQGGHIVCADLKPQARADVVAEQAIDTDELIRQNGGQAVFCKTDVSKAEDVEKMIRHAAVVYGRIDV